jgi:hypothetical protein
LLGYPEIIQNIQIRTKPKFQPLLTATLKTGSNTGLQLGSSRCSAFKNFIINSSPFKVQQILNIESIFQLVYSVFNIHLLGGDLYGQNILSENLLF